MKYELLLPAGDLARLKFAFMYGADAVYIGGYNYSLRANANNFSIDEIKEGVEFAHKLGKKVFVTVNMIFHNEDLDGLDEYLKTLDEIGIDSYIVSDFAVIEAIKRLKIKTPFFISTQKSITNLETVKFYKSLGAYRVVMARECSREDIKRIKENIDTEVEVFIHGAMCTSYSGRCVMSNYVTLRDSNRGGCSQVCRFTFDCGKEHEYAFSSKDLNMIDYISDMMDLGIESYKIEGRMKSLYYIATVANAYRTIMDKKIDGTLTEDDITYYKKVLKEDQIDIFVLGDFQSNDIKDIFKEYFKIDTFKKDNKKVLVKELPIRKRIVRYREYDKVNQSQLLLLCSLNNLTDYERKYVIKLYNELLGGNSNSILFNFLFFSNSFFISLICSFKSSISF